MLRNSAPGRKYIFILLSAHFLLCLFVYFNTNLFLEISESGAVFKTYNSLLNGELILPFQSYYFLSPAYVAFFINYIFGGGVSYYFIFQCLLSTVTVYIVYKIILYITNSGKSAFIAALLTVIYTEYVLLASVFYNQLFDIFFVSLFLLILFHFENETKAKKISAYTFLLLLEIYASMYFRKSLMFIYMIFIILMIFNSKDKKYLLKYSILTVSSFVILFFFNPYKMFNSAYIDNTETLFWGHTLYGGPGGEAAFLFPENEERYNQRMKEYFERNHIGALTREAVDGFEFEEIKTFVKNEPHKWALLQLRKIIYTFGAVPERDGLLMLYKGKIHIHWIIAVLLLQLPYSLILILFLLCVDLSFKEIIHNRFKRIFYSFGLYLLAGICLFGPYQERYRPVIFICFFIPIIAMNFNAIKNLFEKKNRRELIVKIIFVLIVLSIWMYQAYEALFIYHDRYFKVIQ
ncbi:MAG: glycosyltransferase family 39 protein [Ignavibacteria bacterium]|nr:glycosyltransferase family 39 protein [Ignavibacteria bacterium]